MSAFDFEISGELEPRVLYPSMDSKDAMTLTIAKDGDTSLKISGQLFVDDPDFPKRLVILGMCLFLVHIFKPR